MKKELILMMAMMLSSLAFLQLGINIINAASTLDVTAKNVTGKALSVRRIEKQPLSLFIKDGSLNVPLLGLIITEDYAEITNS